MKEVAVIDFSDERLRRARELGASLTLNPKRDDVMARLGDAHGSGDVYGIPLVAGRHGTHAVGDEGSR